MHISFFIQNEEASKEKFFWITKNDITKAEKFVLAEE